MEEKNIIFFLRMLNEFKNNDIPLDVFTPKDKDYLISQDFIFLNENGSYVLTEKGLSIIEKDPSVIVKIQYPLMVKGRVKSYDKVISTMSVQAANALLCAMINFDFLDKINVSNARVFAQHILDSKFHHKWGEKLIVKYENEMKTSMNFFKKKKYKRNV